MAVAKLWEMMNPAIAGLEKEITDLESQIRRQGAPEPLIPRLAEQAKRLQERLEGGAKQMEDLKRLIDEFQKELASLGVDVDELKKSVSALEGRVKTLEEKKDVLTIRGEASMLAVGGFSRDNQPGLSPTGGLLGFGRGSYAGAPVGIGRGLSVIHEGALDLSASVKDLQFRAILSYGNALNTFGGQDARPAGPLAEGASDFYVNHLTGAWTFARMRGKGEITVGRFGHKAGQYLLQRPDYTPYFANPRWDNGEYLIDGAKIDYDWNTVKLTAFAGRTGAAGSNSGTFITRPTISVTNVLFLPVDQVLGVNGRIDLVKGAYVQGAYIYQDSNTRNVQLPGKVVSRMISLGGSAHLNVGPMSIDAGIAKPIYKHGAGTTIDNDNEALYAGASLNLNGFKLGGGYRSVEAFSKNNGDWGRFGTIINPTGFSSVYGQAYVPLGSGYLTGQAEFAEGKGTLGTSGLGSDDKLAHWRLEGGLQLSESWSLFGGYESAKWDFRTGADPYQSWVTLGARLRWPGVQVVVGGQLSDADGKGRPFLNALGNGGRFKGGALFTQLSYSF